MAAAFAAGGGPTFVGGIIGYSFVSPRLCALRRAAGALTCDINGMTATSLRSRCSPAADVTLLVDLLVAFGTDFLLVAVGA